MFGAKKYVPKNRKQHWFDLTLIFMSCESCNTPRRIRCFEKFLGFSFLAWYKDCFRIIKGNDLNEPGGLRVPHWETR